MTESMVCGPGFFQRPFSAQEVADLLGIGVEAVHAGARDGQIPSILIGRKKRLFPRLLIAKLLDGRFHQPAATPEPTNHPGGDGGVIFSNPEAPQNAGLNAGSN
ncbi:MAG: helix-turn-helix domain-containing protein [Planctomycetaceae bacterium]|nr:helix-turn-helix domain-containing protein [Planctomycetaceae bacterium]